MSVPLCTAWLLYWGRRLGMSTREVLHARIGEILDQIDCDAIAHGATPKGRKRSFDELMMLR